MDSGAYERSYPEEEEGMLDVSETDHQPRRKTSSRNSNHHRLHTHEHSRHHHSKQNLHNPNKQRRHLHHASEESLTSCDGDCHRQYIKLPPKHSLLHNDQHLSDAEQLHLVLDEDRSLNQVQERLKKKDPEVSVTSASSLQHVPRSDSSMEREALGSPSGHPGPQQTGNYRGKILVHRVPYLKKLHLIILSVCFSLVLISILVPLTMYLNKKKELDEEYTLNFPSINCSGDGFKSQFYSFVNSRGETVRRHIKYRFVDDAIAEEFYNFPRAKTECEKLGATLWEVLDGEPEWTTFITLAKDLNRADMWINAEIVGECDRETIDYSLNICKEEEASKGKGLIIKWPSMNHSLPHYSRLIHGKDPGNPQNEKCVYVDQYNDYLWEVADCEFQTFWGLCVKRRCIFPPD